MPPSCEGSRLWPSAFSRATTSLKTGLIIASMTWSRSSCKSSASFLPRGVFSPSAANFCWEYVLKSISSIFFSFISHFPVKCLTRLSSVLHELQSMLRPQPIRPELEFTPLIQLRSIFNFSLHEHVHFSDSRGGRALITKPRPKTRIETEAITCESATRRDNEDDGVISP